MAILCINGLFGWSRPHCIDDAHFDDAGDAVAHDDYQHEVHRRGAVYGVALLDMAGESVRDDEVARVDGAADADGEGDENLGGVDSDYGDYSIHGL